jgi:hypothetical protein
MEWIVFFWLSELTMPLCGITYNNNGVQFVKQTECHLSKQKSDLYFYLNEYFFVFTGIRQRKCFDKIDIVNEWLIINSPIVMELGMIIDPEKSGLWSF